MNRGDVIMVDWQFSDQRGSKLRPAIVVQADFLNLRIDDTILIPITRTSRASGSTEVAIDPAVERASGLRFVSVASCHNFLTIDQSLVVRSLGRLSPTIMQQIDAALKLALHLN